jgi:hypothetical protein
VEFFWRQDFEPHLTDVCGDLHLTAEACPVEKGALIEIAMLLPKPKGG